MTDQHDIDRRSFITAAIGSAAGVGAMGFNVSAAAAEAASGGTDLSRPPAGAPGSGGQFSPIRAEVTIRDCEVEGKLPLDLDGGFFATGPDPQYPRRPGNIMFDGEGHVRVFRIKDGHVDYRTRYARGERYLAQDKARKSLYPMYRNPYMDDPSVRGLSRATGNTHVINHKGLILALKEDTPPIAMDINTLETVDPIYTFGGQLPATQPFTAHPKTCSITGNILAFGYEAEGFGSDVVSVFEIDKRTSKKLWEAKFKVPYVGMIHDFGITENHVMFYVVPLAIDMDQMKRGGIHWSWDKTKKTYFGFFRRGGDAKDIKWFEGPAQSGTHTMGVFEDGNKLYFDTEMTAGNPFPFMPNKDGSPPDFKAAESHLHRISVNISGKNKGYDVERLYPVSAPLPRQDDRYNTVPYRYGYAACPDPNAPNRAVAGACYTRMDLQTRTFKLWNAGSQISLAEPVFAPKNAKSREGEGYLMGIAYHLDQNLRSDLVILDAERVEDGPIATVKLPVQASPQVHGLWVRGDLYPA
jgi:carotenoid cleavage dioxygenase